MAHHDDTEPNLHTVCERQAEILEAVLLMFYRVRSIDGCPVEVDIEELFPITAAIERLRGTIDVQRRGRHLIIGPGL